MPSRAGAFRGVAIAVAILSVTTSVSTRRQAVGVLDVVIDEWAVPNDSFPHDPAVAPDGSINKIAAIDRESLEITEFALPPGARPRLARVRVVNRGMGSR